METFYMVTIFLLGFSLVYLLIKNQVFKALNERLHELYKEKIESDIQDIYREFESYSAIIDSRINRLKALTERQEASLKAWEAIQNDLKKSKTAKEILNYMETYQNDSSIGSEEIENIKKEITSELKKFLASKLNLVETNSFKPEKTPSKNLFENQKIKEKKEAVSPKLNFSKTDEEFNAAELILEDLDDEDSRLKSKKAPESFLKPKENHSNNKTESKEEKSDVEGNKFLSTLASIGKTLSPVFMKSEPAPVEPLSSARPQGNFNELIRKEAVFTPPKPPQEPKEEISEEKVSINTNLKPNELYELIESLKTSRSRPEALKSLLGYGFDLNQIAELSSIPYSDLELTRNLYKI